MSGKPAQYEIVKHSAAHFSKLSRWTSVSSISARRRDIPCGTHLPGRWNMLAPRRAISRRASHTFHLMAFGKLLVGIVLIVGVFTRFSASMSVVMALFFAGAISMLPHLLPLSLATSLVGTTASRFGLDYLARPLELKLFHAARQRFGPAAHSA